MKQCSELNNAKSGTQVFIGGMAATTTEMKIHEIFSSCGEIVEINLIKNRKGLLKGYGFVRFATKEAADKAIKEKSGSLVDGKDIGVLPSKEQATLFMGNLHEGWDAEEFEKFVRQVLPDVVSVNLEMLEGVQSGQKPRNRGCGFVKFSSHTAAVQAYRASSVADFVLAGNVHPSVKLVAEEQTDPEEVAKVKVAYVRDLPTTADKNYMKKLFEPCGKVDKVVLQRKGNSQVGFIYFDNHLDLENAIKEMSGKVVQGPQRGSPFKLQVAHAKSQDKKRKRALQDLPSKQPTIVQSQSTLPQNYLGVHSSGVSSTRMLKDQHAEFYENAVYALPLSVKERLLRILRLGIASPVDIDEDCLFRLKELPESNAISVLDEFMLSGVGMQDKGPFLSGLISTNLVRRVRLSQFPLSLSREASTLSIEPVVSTLSRRTHLPVVMDNNTSLASYSGSSDTTSDIYASRCSELHSDNYLSSHSILRRMKDESTSDRTAVASIGNARGRLSSGVASLTDRVLSRFHATPSSYTDNQRIGLHSPLEASVERTLSPLRSIVGSDMDNVRVGLNSHIDGHIYGSVSPSEMMPRPTARGRVGLTCDEGSEGSLSPLRPIARSDIDNVRVGLNSHIDGPNYESILPSQRMPRPTAYGRVGLAYDAAEAVRRAMEMARTSSISYSRVASHLVEPTTAIRQQSSHQTRFDPVTGEPYRFDPFTGEPIPFENASSHYYLQ